MASPFPIPLRGHQDAFERLRDAVARGRLAHAYLFVGPPGVGKKRFAFGIAQCLLCQSRPEHELTACGTCPGCRQVLARTHPDLLFACLPEGKKEFPLALLLGDKERRGKEGLLYDLSLRPMAGGRRVAILDDAERLNEESSNALLKTLEEPPPASVLILVSTSADQLLPTIRSRCQVLRFSPLLHSDVAELLLEHGLTEDAKEADNVAPLSQGSLETAAQLLDPNLRKQRERLYAGLASAPFQATRLAADINAAIEAAGSERSAKVRLATWIVQFGAEFFRQSLRHLASPGPPAPGPIASFASRLKGGPAESLDVVCDLLERCMAAEEQLGGNVVIPLCIEMLFSDVSRTLRAQVV